MQEKECMCTAVFCGHALGERCPHPVLIALKIRITADASNADFGPEIEIGICRTCWLNLQRYLPNLFPSATTWEKAG